MNQVEEFLNVRIVDLLATARPSVRGSEFLYDLNPNLPIEKIILGTPELMSQWDWFDSFFYNLAHGDTKLNGATYIDAFREAILRLETLKAGIASQPYKE